MAEHREPPDSKTYHVWFYVHKVEFLRDSVQFAENLLTDDLRSIEQEAVLGSLLTPGEISKLPIGRLLRQLRWCREWLCKELKSASGRSDPPDRFDDLHLDLDHKTAKLIKSAAVLYIRHLRIQRNQFASRQNISRHVLQALDQRIAELEELPELGVFKDASIIPLLADELLLAERTPEESEASTPAAHVAGSLTYTQRPRPVIHTSIEILDPVLRSRCLDLFEQFRSGGNTERLDTVVAEASRILEDRLRKNCGAEATCVGVNLAAFAFGGKPSPRLILSPISQEQDGAHALFRGLFGFLRNRVGHHIIEDLRPERVLQIVALIDYLLHLIDTAETDT